MPGEALYGVFDVSAAEVESMLGALAGEFETDALWLLPSVKKTSRRACPELRRSGNGRAGTGLAGPLCRPSEFELKRPPIHVRASEFAVIVHGRPKISGGVWAEPRSGILTHDLKTLGGVFLFPFLVEQFADLQRKCRRLLRSPHLAVDVRQLIGGRPIIGVQPESGFEFA